MIRTAAVTLIAVNLSVTVTAVNLIATVTAVNLIATATVTAVNLTVTVTATLTAVTATLTAAVTLTAAATLTAATLAPNPEIRPSAGTVSDRENLLAARGPETTITNVTSNLYFTYWPTHQGQRRGAGPRSET